MGQCCCNAGRHNKIDGATVFDLSLKTGMDINELQRYYFDFMKEFPNGHLTKKQFQKVYLKFFPEERDSQSVAQKVFATFDQNGDGTIDFREFVIALSMLSQGTLAQKLSLAFYLYDENGDGVLVYQEVLDIVKLLYGMADGPGNAKDLPEAEVFAKGLFAELDKDNNGEVSLDEFIEVGCGDPVVANLLLANL